MSATKSLVHFVVSAAALCGVGLAGCSRTASETGTVQVANATATRAEFDKGNSTPAVQERAGSLVEPASPTVVEEQPATASSPSTDNSPAQDQSVATDVPAAAPVATESRLDRARRVVETEGLIAKAIYDISQGSPTEKEASLLEDIAAKERLYRLLAADIANDAENLATAGLIMPWELRTRDVERNLALGRSPFRRRVSSGSLGLSQQIGNEQLESVRQTIDESRRSLLSSRMRRAWTTLTPHQQALCEKYQPEFAAEASGRNDTELARLNADMQGARSPTTLIVRGKIHAARGNFQQAQDDLSQALSSPLDDEDAIRLLRAEIAMELGNTNAAVRDYQFVAEKRGPLSDRAYVAWGKLLAQRAPADAMNKAEEALKVNANCAAAHALLADIYKSMNQRRLTIESLQAAARLAPEDPTHFYRLGNLQAALSANDEAVEAYTQSIAADPTWWRPYAGRSTMHYRRRDFEAALKDLQDAGEWAPREPSIYENRAFLLEAMGRLDEAQRDRASAKTLAAGGVL
jgi:tetratricopeptide (TPR) repeat protein